MATPATKDVYHYVEFKNGTVGGLYTPDQLPARLAQIAQSETPPVVTEPTRPVTPPVTPVLPTVGAQSGEVGKPFSFTLPDFGMRIDVSLVDTVPLGVDTFEDLVKARLFYQNTRV